MADKEREPLLSRGSAAGSASHLTLFQQASKQTALHESGRRMLPKNIVGRFMSYAGTFGEWVGRNLLFSDVIDSDKRLPCMIFTVPANILQWFGVDHGGNKFGLLAPRIEFWIAVVVVRERLTLRNEISV